MTKPLSGLCLFDFLFNVFALVTGGFFGVFDGLWLTPFLRASYLLSWG